MASDAQKAAEALWLRMFELPPFQHEYGTQARLDILTEALAAAERRGAEQMRAEAVLVAQHECRKWPGQNASRVFGVQGNANARVAATNIIKAIAALPLPGEPEGA